MSFPRGRIRFFLLFMLVFSFTHCERNPNPYTEKTPETEPHVKDGVIDILVKESGQINDTTYFFNTVDTLPISETENALEINAVPFSFPQARSLQFFFKGDFHDMENSVCVLYELYSPSLKRVVTNFEFIKNNQGVGIFLDDRQWNTVDPTKRLQAFAFALDTDSTHSGTGKITVTADHSSDTVFVDATVNTVDYTKVASVLELTFSEKVNNVDISGQEDADSYLHLKHSAIWLLFHKGDSKIYQFATANTGAGFSFIDDTRHDFLLYGFAPKFFNHCKEAL